MSVAEEQELPAGSTPLPPLVSLEGSAPPEANAQPARSGWWHLLREVVETIILTAVIYAAVNFATGRFRVEGDSMQPNIHPNEYVLVDKISYRLGAPQRGDIVVFNYPLATERDFIKRVIGLPGETLRVQGGTVFVNDQPLEEPYVAAPPRYESGPVTLGENEYFVLGDNRNSSSDSHSWGSLGGEYIIGRAVLIYWPPADWDVVSHFSYAN